MAVRAVGVAVSVLAAALLAPGCNGGDGAPGESEGVPECLDAPGPLDCEPLYGVQGDRIAPTFEDVFVSTLSKRCGVAYCHAGDTPKAGMRLDDPSTARAALLAESSTGGPRVVPGDIACGAFIVRLEAVGKDYSMPRGNHLSEGELCSIRHWIANGAPP